MERLLVPSGCVLLAMMADKSNPMEMQRDAAFIQLSFQRPHETHECGNGRESMRHGTGHGVRILNNKMRQDQNGCRPVLNHDASLPSGNVSKSSLARTFWKSLPNLLT